MPALPGGMKSLLVGLGGLMANVGEFAGDCGLSVTKQLNEPPPSRAGSLPQGICGGYNIDEQHEP